MSDSQTHLHRETKLNLDFWQSSILCLCLVDSECGLIQVSNGFVNLISTDTDQGLSAGLDQIIHPEDRQDFISELKRVCSEKVLIERRRVRVVTPDGRVTLMSVYGEPWIWDTDNCGVLLSWRKVTGEDREVSWGAADDLDEFHEISKRFIASLFDPVLLLNTEGRIIDFNPSVQEMLDYRRVELVGKPVAVLFENRSELMQKAMIRFAKMMRAGQIRDQSTYWLKKDGERVPVTASSSMIRSSSGELIGMVVVGRDERKNALLKDLENKNIELEQAYQHLKELDRMKDDLLSLVGHEIRAPLANILGYAEFLNEWELTEEEKKSYIRIIYQESHHLRRLVNDILDLTRMESGRLVFNYIRDSINRAVQSGLDSVLADAEKKELKIELELDDQLEPMEFDPDRIQQVVTNILHNAIKFTDPGKTINIRTEAVEGGVRVSIRDEGVGINPDDVQKVFNKFEQILDVKHHSEGAGLGMPIAKNIVEEGHGGKIWIESEGRGKGSTFRFTIPEVRKGT